MTAAAARKLQKEIDNVLKKVDDGMSEFDEHWEQAIGASNNQQKERLGEELKKSINKLQRLRAQMREWIGQSAVPSAAKDKLEEARRKIENDMQRFKEFERDLKTKAFSTCALARTDELELEEAEKMKYQDWLSQTIQTLNDQLDLFEADLELLGNKKSLSNDDKSRSLELKTFTERHRWHSQKLELILRALDNDALELSDLAVIKESVELYVDTHQEQDYYHDEGLYDCFDLAAFEEGAVKPPRSPTVEASGTPVSTPVGSKEEPLKKGKEKEKQRKADKKDKKKEEKEKKAANSATSNSNNPSGGGSTKAGSSPQIVQVDAKAPLMEKLDLDEVKVQEDQLLSEAEEFICKICQIHVVGCSPKLTSCSHLFCGDCIAQWFAQHPESQTWAQRAKSAGPERVVPCPVCKQPLNEKKDLYPVCGVTSRSENLLLWRMLSSLKIMCANHPKASPDGKCDWIGEYGSYQKHIKVCKNQPLPEGAAQITESPAPRLPNLNVDSESEAGESSKDASRLTTPAITPAAAPRMSPTSPSPMPPLEPQLVPRAEAAATPVSSPCANSEARSPVAGSSQPVANALPGRPSPGLVTAATPAPAAEPGSRSAGSSNAVADSNRASPQASAGSPGGGLWPAGEQASAKQAAPEARSPAAETNRGIVSSPPAVPERPAVSRTKAETETEPAIAPASAAPPKTGVAPGHSTTGPASALHEPQAARPTAGSTPSSPKEESSTIVKAASSFEPTGPSMVQVQVGDRIQVLEQHNSGWTYCKNLSLGNASNVGWVPSWISQAPPASEARPAPAPAPVAQAPAAQAKPKAPAAKAESSSGTSNSAQARNVVRATSAFCAATASQLNLAPSDLVDIVERHSSGWTYGRKVIDAPAGTTSPVVEGWFPDWVVAQK